MPRLINRKSVAATLLLTLCILIPAIMTPARTSAAGDYVIVAAGDIVCDPSSSSFNGGKGTSSSCHMLATANLIASIAPNSVLVLGDNQYYCGSYTAYTQAYNLSWGQYRWITLPVPGNHEYQTSGSSNCSSANSGAAGYYKYWGVRQYYSWNLGSWHVIALNTQCSSVGGCGTGSAQETWLKNDLAANPTACTLAFFHIPRWSSGGRASSNSAAFITDLYNANADVVLTGHDHIYERFAPQNPSGGLDYTRGIREFVVGTGGSNHTSLSTTAANSIVRNATTFGVLKMTLHATSYDWKFYPEAGQIFTDSGTYTCH